ncbi:hypothetical protein J19TS2_15800 [Cohnella xylanilytica]|nr:hypothetical protein J19TS2_15800 [Cohnella xylanilytica]
MLAIFRVRRDCGANFIRSSPRVHSGLNAKKTNPVPDWLDGYAAIDGPSWIGAAESFHVHLFLSAKE